MGQKKNYLVLIIGDSGDLIDSLGKQLKAAGFTSIAAASGSEGLGRLNERTPDVVILTIPLAHEDGLALCAQIRTESTVPILAVTGRGSDQDCVNALGAGADDYIAKPFSPRCLEARILAAIRRANSEPYRSEPARRDAQPQVVGVLQSGSIQLDLTTCRVSIDGVVKSLTPNEFRLMAIFLRAPGEVFTREDLRRRVWPDDQHSLHLVEVHIANLRVKIERDPHHPTHIVTVRSTGYRLAVPA